MAAQNLPNPALRTEGETEDCGALGGVWAGCDVEASPGELAACMAMELGCDGCGAVEPGDCVCHGCVVCRRVFSNTDRRSDDNPAVCQHCHAARLGEEARADALREVGSWGLEWALERTGHVDAAEMLLATDREGAAAAAACVLVGWFLRALAPMAAAVELDPWEQWNRASSWLWARTGAPEARWRGAHEAACLAARRLPPLMVGQAARHECNGCAGKAALRRVQAAGDPVAEYRMGRDAEAPTLDTEAALARANTARPQQAALFDPSDAQ